MHTPTRSLEICTAAPRSRAQCGGFIPVVLLGFIAISVTLGTGCGSDPGPSPGGGSAGVGAPADIFEFGRSGLGMVRTDTRNGRVWVVPMNGDGGWLERGDAPDLGGFPAAPGRFETLRTGVSRGPRGGSSDGPSLIRVDHATGRAWLLESDDSDVWVLVRDPDGSPEASLAPTASAEVPARSTGTNAGSSSQALDPDMPDVSYPILTGDQLGTTPQEKQETLTTLHNALTKEGLPSKMRLWAVRQLGELEPDLAVPELLIVLDDDDPVIVAEAVRQLGRSGRASTIPRILQLQNHPDPGVRAAVAETVVQVN